MPVVRNARGQFASNGVLGKFARNPAQRQSLASFVKGGGFHGVKGSAVRERLGNIWASQRRESAAVVKAHRAGAKPGIVFGSKSGVRTVLNSKGLSPGAVTNSVNALWAAGFTVARRQGRRH